MNFLEKEEGPMYIWGMETMMEKNFQEWRTQKQVQTLQKKDGTIGTRIKDILIRHAFSSLTLK